jgi:arginine utilization protein RocB
MDLGERAFDLLPELTSFQSVSATPGEGDIARHIYSVLFQHRYFKENPQLLQITPITAPGNPAVVAALVKGKGNRALILLNHHDVVDAGDYGNYRDLAFDPLKLTAALNPRDLSESARADLAGGNWLFGRGIMDMLYGLALQLALVEKAATHPDRLPGSLLFLSVPDEENNSLGMRRAVNIVRNIQEQHSLDFAAAVNCEPHDLSGGAHLVQTGSDGKILPLICCFGREAHAAAVYGGLNAHLLLSGVIRELELNTMLCDRSGGEITMPPTVLLAGDLKNGYNVTTPGAAFAFFNVFTLSATPRQIMNRLISICERALVNALEIYKLSAAAWSEAKGTPLRLPEWRPKVLTYEQMWQQCLEFHGRRLIQDMDRLACRLQEQGGDIQRLTLEMISELHQYCPDRDPKIVIALAPPFYPPVRNRGENHKEKHVLAAVRELQGYAKTLGVELKREEFHRGISDLSYCQLQDAAAVIDILRNNCPAWDRAYHLPLEEIALLDAPAVNLGPFGRDFHKFTERLHVPYAREKLPLLLERLVTTLLENDPR